MVTGRSSRGRNSGSRARRALVRETSKTNGRTSCRVKVIFVFVYFKIGEVENLLALIIFTENIDITFKKLFS